MTSKSEYFANLIFEKLKKYKYKKISLDKESLKKFILLLSKGS